MILVQYDSVFSIETDGMLQSSLLCYDDESSEWTNECYPYTMDMDMDIDIYSNRFE